MAGYTALLKSPVGAVKENAQHRPPVGKQC